MVFSLILRFQKNCLPTTFICLSFLLVTAFSALLCDVTPKARARRAEPNGLRKGPSHAIGRQRAVKGLEAFILIFFLNVMVFSCYLQRFRENVLRKTFFESHYIQSRGRMETNRSSRDFGLHLISCKLIC